MIRHEILLTTASPVTIFETLLVTQIFVTHGKILFFCMDRRCGYRTRYTRYISDKLFIIGIPSPPVIQGLDQPVRVSDPPNITCNTNYFWGANASFVWRLNGKEVLGRSGVMMKYDNNSARFTSILVHQFTKDDDESTLTCSVRANTDVHRDITVTTSESVTLYCKLTVFIYLSTCMLCT